MRNSYRNAEGQLHRTDGPAYEHSSGTKAWFIDGKRHRIDGPAYEHSSGTKAWYIDGKRHRIDGPAIEWTDGSKEWWINDKDVTKEINNWLHENNIQYPFDEDNMVQFKLRWL